MHNPLPPPPTDPKDDDAYYREVLQNLIARGAELAVQIHESATKPETHPESVTEAPQKAKDPRRKDAVEATLAYDRILRAIRRTIALARDIAEYPIGSRPRRAAPATPAEKPKKHSPDRIRITQRIQKAIERYRDRGDAVLIRNIFAYIPDKDLHGHIDGLPFNQVAGEILKELNIDIEAMWNSQPQPDIKQYQPGPIRPHPRTTPQAPGT